MNSELVSIIPGQAVLVQAEPGIGTSLIEESRGDFCRET
jgi:hypothetical protein